MIKKILIYRDKKTNKIIELQECPDYETKQLLSIIEEFNKDTQHSVEVHNVKENSLEEYVLRNYWRSKANTEEEIKTCVNRIHAEVRHLNVMFDLLYQDYTNKIDKIK